MSKVYLRELIINGRFGLDITLSIFKGDTKSDRDYFEKTQGAFKVRYFELKEIKGDD